jgi:hypothetical protein
VQKYLLNIFDGEDENWSQAFSDLVSNIALKNSSIYIDGGVAGSIGNQTFPFKGVVSKATGGDGPMAYLNWIIADRNGIPIDQGYTRLSNAPAEHGQDVGHEKLFTEIVIKEAGLVYLFLSNENPTPVEVYFDDFKVEHIKSLVISTTDYYPFGLTFNSFQRETMMSQNMTFVGKEIQDELDLGWLDFGKRMYAADIQRLL